MKNKELIALAKRVASEAHAGQTRRDGLPYVTHPEAVAAAVYDAAKPVAWLHDVLEDCPGYTAGRLRDYGFPEDIVLAVVALTKVDGESYAGYLTRVASNKMATVVKVADIRHNLSGQPKPEKVEKYRKALEFLENVLINAKDGEQKIIKMFTVKPELTRIPFADRCSVRCKTVYVYEEHRKLVCRNCGRTIDPFDYLWQWAIEGDHRMDSIKGLDAEIRHRQNQLDDLNRQIRNAKAALRRT